MDKEKVYAFTLRMPLSTYTRIAILAEKDNRSMNNFINQILIEYLAKNEKNRG